MLFVNCCVCQVSDWEEGGRTSAEHAERIFGKERTEDPHAVHAVLHRYSVSSIVPLTTQPCTMHALTACVQQEQAYRAFEQCPIGGVSF